MTPLHLFAPPVPQPTDNSDDVLVARLRALAQTEREVRADFIVLLAEVDQRRLYLKAGYRNLFAWLTDHLHLSKASAYRRMTAARLHARMPAVAAYLREGRLSLTKLCHLKDVLTPENCLTLLEQAASKTETEVEELAIVLDPNRKPPALRDSIRPVPALQQRELVLAPPPTAPPSCAAPAPVAPAPPAAPPPPVLHVIKMTVGTEFMQLLDEVRDAMSHSHPDANLETLLGECMSLALRAHRKRTRAETDRPRPAKPTKPAADPPRAAPAAVRREVWERDQGRCAFVAADGRRCNSTCRLQINHVKPYARGGRATADNLQLLCWLHNDLQARADFGDAHMDKYTGSRRSGRSGSGGGTVAGGDTGPPARSAGALMDMSPAAAPENRRRRAAADIPTAPGRTPPSGPPAPP